MKRKNTNEEKELIKILNTNSHIIERISNDRTKSMLDINNHGNAYFVKNDWQEEIVAHYNFFITMVGLIEANIINIARIIHTEKDKDKLNDLTDHLEILIKKREKVVDGYLKLQTDNDLSVVSSIINEPFLYEHLDKIYADLEVNNYKYNLHQEFVSAYNQGSKLAKNCDLRKVFLIYTKLFLTFNKTKVCNKERINKTGNAKILHKILVNKNSTEKNQE